MSKSVPQQIFIPGLNMASSQQQIQKNNEAAANEEKKQSETSNDINSLAYQLNENQLNDLFNLLNTKQDDSYFKNPLAKHEKQIQERNSRNKIIPKAEVFNQHNNEMESYFKEASTSTASTATTSKAATVTTASTTTKLTTTSKKTESAATAAARNNKQYANYNSEKNAKPIAAQKPQSLPLLNNNVKAPISYGSNKAPKSLSSSMYGSLESIALDDCSIVRDSRRADKNYCNLYHLCSNGIHQALLCPESYLYSVSTQKCEHRSQVDCSNRLALDFDRSNVPDMDFTINDYYNAARTPTIINGTLECSLGSDGYFPDPEFCNIYHHCLAGVDYAEQCPHQLVWNDKKKMCDWQTSVNCTGRVIPVAQGYYLK